MYTPEEYPHMGRLFIYGSLPIYGASPCRKAEVRSVFKNIYVEIPQQANRTPIALIWSQMRCRCAIPLDEHACSMLAGTEVIRACGSC